MSRGILTKRLGSWAGSVRRKLRKTVNADQFAVFTSWKISSNEVTVAFDGTYIDRLSIVHRFARDTYVGSFIIRLIRFLNANEARVKRRKTRSSPSLVPDFRHRGKKTHSLARRTRRKGRVSDRCSQTRRGDYLKKQRKREKERRRNASVITVRTNNDHSLVHGGTTIRRESISEKKELLVSIEEWLDKQQIIG